MSKTKQTPKKVQLQELVDSLPLERFRLSNSREWQTRASLAKALLYRLAANGNPDGTFTITYPNGSFKNFSPSFDKQLCRSFAERTADRLFKSLVELGLLRIERESAECGRRVFTILVSNFSAVVSPRPVTRPKPITSDTRDETASDTRAVTSDTPEITSDTLEAKTGSLPTPVTPIRSFTVLIPLSTSQKTEPEKEKPSFDADKVVEGIKTKLIEIHEKRTKTVPMTGRAGKQPLELTSAIRHHLAQGCTPKFLVEQYQRHLQETKDDHLQWALVNFLAKDFAAFQEVQLETQRKDRADEERMQRQSAQNDAKRDAKLAAKLAADAAEEAYAALHEHEIGT